MIFQFKWVDIQKNLNIQYPTSNIQYPTSNIQF